jgi:hypothetical protein
LPGSRAVFCPASSLRSEVAIRGESEKEGIKGYGYGSPVLIDYEIDGKQQRAVLHKDSRFQLEAAISGVDPKDIDIEVTPEDIILKAETQRRQISIDKT